MATLPSPPPSRKLSRSIHQPSRNLRAKNGDVAYLNREDVLDLHAGVSREFSGVQAQPREVANEFGLNNALERPKATTMGREAFPEFYEKAAALFFALLQNLPFESNNQRAAVASLVAFCDINDRQIDTNILDERTLEHLVRHATSYREKGADAQTVFSEIRQIFSAAIKS